MNAADRGARVPTSTLQQATHNNERVAHRKRETNTGK